MKNTILSIVILLITFTSCSGNRDTFRIEEPILYPPPPDQPRIQYLTSFSTSNDFVGKKSAFMRFVTGDDESLPILKPYGLAVGFNKIYICDTMLGGLEILDMQNGEFYYFIPEGRGRLIRPINCFVDNAGFLYVADSERKQVIIFNEDFEYSAEIGDSLLFKPTDVFVDDDKIFINDIDNHSITIYEKSSRKFLKRIPDLSEKNKLYSPTNIFVSDNKIYVSDLGDSKIKVYDLDGKHIQTIGNIGSVPGKFSRPKGIALDSDENLYVVDSGFENVQIFNNQGNLLMYFGGTYKKPGDMWLPAKVTIDYTHTDYFKKYVDPAFNIKYLIFVTNQYGPEKVNVYAFLSAKHE